MCRVFRRRTNLHLTGAKVKKILLALTTFVATLCCHQLAAQTQINQANISAFPYTIVQPGSYILTSNINIANTGSNLAIIVSAPNVTINLNGYTITGPCPTGGCSTGSEGIYANPGYTNTTVENGQVTGFTYGVDIQSGDIHDISVTEGNYCIYASNATIRHNVVANCYEYGIYGQNSTISDNIVSGAAWGGIVGFYSSIYNNTSNNNAGWGIEAVGGVLSGNTAMHNPTNEDFWMGSNAVSSKNNASTNGAY
jgi:hypothetical protein